MREFSEKYKTYLTQFVQYIRNTTHVPLRQALFDDDWDPIGPLVRGELIELGWTTENLDGITLTEKAPQ